MSEYKAAEILGQTPDYRDELNFAEFPLASLTDKPPRDVKTLVFSDQIFDQGKRQLVPRKLTVSASDEHGLPTPLDEEVLLGLLQLSHQRGFDSSTVHFSRYQLIKLLGWRDETKSYRRIEESLKRWVGVTLYYDRAWWSREEQCWVSENFHVINQVTLFDRERRARRKELDPQNPAAGHSSIVWSEPVFKSFQAGNLKPLNLKLYTSFRTAIAKRVFRFLDKRFHFRSKLEFDLREFACEHIGIAKSCPNAEIRRRLTPGLEELVQAGFLAAATSSERFTKSAWGKWQVHFQKARGARKELAEAKQVQDPQLLKLCERGISARTARRLIASYSRELIEEKIALVEWLTKRGDGKPIRNPAGFLVKAIMEDYPAPKEFAGSRLSKTVAAAPSPAPYVAQSETPTDSTAARERQALAAHLDTLDKTSRASFEKAAFELTDNNLLRRQYLDGLTQGGGSLFEAVREQILLSYFKRQLAERKAA